MKAELSHHGFINQKKMTGVYLQQGRMITDRDFNALCEILKAQFENIGDKSIGTGVPRHDGLLHNFSSNQSPASEWSAEFPIKGGWVVANGVLGEARSHGYNPDIDVEDEPDDVDDFTVTTQRDLPQASSLFNQNKEGIYYVDIWDEVVNALDDSDIMDPAFHGADSCFTTQRRVQIKKCHESAIKAIEDKITDQDFSCGYEINSEVIPPRGNCGFSIEMSDTANGTDPCNPCEGEVEIEKELGNFLFRLEVHVVDFNADGKPIKIALKWSRENGAYEIEGGTGTVFAQDYSYEMFTQDTDLEMGVPAGGFSHASGRYDHLFHGSDATDYIDSFKARRWDGFAVLDIEGNLESGFHRGVPFPLGNYKVGNSLKLTLGDLEVDLEIDGKLILTGDYWLALARSRTTEKIRALSNLPIGIKHHYCLLGYTEDGQRFTGLTPGDKRRLNFPSLSCLHAEDISYKSNCDHAEGATNVNEALDLICDAVPDPHHVLKMSAGTGQEAYLGQALPGLIRVLVEDENGRPVANAKVRFTLTGVANGMDVISFGTQTSSDYIVLETGFNGTVQLSWSLRGSIGEHLLRASLVAPPQGHAGAIWFSALAKERSIYPMVKQITWADGSSFRNDWAVNGKKLTEGFTVHFLEEILQELVTPDVITLHMEFFSQVETSIKSHNLIVCGSIITDTHSVTYIPDNQFLATAIRELRVNGSDDPHECAREGIRFRIKLHGRFVFDKEGRPFDAFVPGMPAVDEFHKPYAEKDTKVDFDESELIPAGIFVPRDIIEYDPLPPEFSSQNVPAFAMRSASVAQLDTWGQQGSLVAGHYNSGFYNEWKNYYVEEQAAATNHKPTVVFTSQKRRIALNYAERGIGQPSDLEAWFYVQFPRDNDDGVIDGGVNEDIKDYKDEFLAINTATKDIAAEVLGVSDVQLANVEPYLKHIRDASHFASIIGLKGDNSELEKRFNFTLGYQTPAFDDERFIIKANTDKYADKLHRTGLLDCKQVSQLLAGQPWDSLGGLYSKLGIYGTQLERVKGRIIIDNPESPNDPSPNTPPKEESEQDKQQPSKDNPPEKESENDETGKPTSTEDTPKGLEPKPDPDPTPTTGSIFWVNEDSEDKMIEIFGKDLPKEDRAAFLDFRNNLRSPIKNVVDLIRRLRRRQIDKAHMQNLIKVFAKYKNQLGYVKAMP